MMVFLLALYLNLLMILVSIFLYFIQDEPLHLYMAVLWTVLAFIGFRIRERFFSDHPHSK